MADYIRHMISIYYFKRVLYFTGKITGKFFTKRNVERNELLNKIFLGMFGTFLL
jgi:hypothetical protein